MYFRKAASFAKLCFLISIDSDCTDSVSQSRDVIHMLCSSSYTDMFVKFYCDLGTYVKSIINDATA